METPHFKHSWTQDDFDELSLHDNYIHGLALKTENWKGDLVFDIDHIAKWVCDANSCRFWVAPADLTFHHVTDLTIHIQWQQSGFQVSVHEMSIHDLRRELIVEQKICLDQQYYKWTMEINWPEGGLITFGSTGFTLLLRRDPIFSSQQMLSADNR